MKNASAASPVAETQYLDVTISITAGSILVFPQPLCVPWNFDGIIRWTIEGDASFEDEGIVFAVPFGSGPVPTGSNPRVRERAVNNDRLDAVGPFGYTIKYVTPGGSARFHDPTVENDPPSVGDVRPVNGDKKPRRGPEHR